MKENPLFSRVLAQVAEIALSQQSDSDDGDETEPQEDEADSPKKQPSPKVSGSLLYVIN